MYLFLPWARWLAVGLRRIKGRGRNLEAIDRSLYDEVVNVESIAYYRRW